jgi:hypothetical protein
MKNKTCMICKTTVDIDEEFVTVEQYAKKGKLKSKGWYHINCFRERLDGSQFQKAVSLRAIDILDKIGARV